jgi:hypothetical protein
MPRRTTAIQQEQNNEPNDQEISTTQHTDDSPDISESLLQFQDVSKPPERDDTVTKEQVKRVANKLALIFETSTTVALITIGMLLRKGAANKNTPPSLSVVILNNGTKITVSKYDLLNAMDRAIGHQRIKALAETMAPDIISSSFKLIEQNPNLGKQLMGDLARQINKQLMAQNKPTLTEKESICCASYCQYMEDLNTIAESTRLRELLIENLNNRLSQRKNRSNSKK